MIPVDGLSLRPAIPVGVRADRMTPRSGLVPEHLNHRNRHILPVFSGIPAPHSLAGVGNWISVLVLFIGSIFVGSIYTRYPLLIASAHRCQSNLSIFRIYSEPYQAYPPWGKRMSSVIHLVAISYRISAKR